MPEPVRRRLRPIAMMRTLAVFVVVLVLLGGCGSSKSSSGDSAGSPEESASAMPTPTGTPKGTPSVPADEPPVTSSYAVDVPGLPGPVQVTEQRHPRGGFQLRVFLANGATWSELTLDGRALLPFVALDVEEHPWTIDCGDRVLVFTEAVAHKPAGVMFAWDIRRTTYFLEGNTVTAGPTEEVADNVLPKKLSTQYGQLSKHAAFTSCRAAG